MTENASKPQRRQSILDAAVAVFNAKGCANATVDDIAARAGVSKGSLYNYFSSKEDLLAKVFVETFDVEHAEVDRLAREPLPATEKLQRLMEHVFKRLESFTRLGKLVMALWSEAIRKDKLADTMAEIHAHWRTHIQAILVEGVQSGEFGTHFDPAIASSLIWATLNGIIVQAMFDREAESSEHSLASLKRALLTAMRLLEAIPDQRV